MSAIRLVFCLLMLHRWLCVPVLAQVWSVVSSPAAAALLKACGFRRSLAEAGEATWTIAPEQAATVRSAIDAISTLSKDVETFCLPFMPASHGQIHKSTWGKSKSTASGHNHVCFAASAGGQACSNAGQTAGEASVKSTASNGARDDSAKPSL
eukprot:scaffold212977_cov37-Prasinocladus_malaysianus.AAC.1